MQDVAELHQLLTGVISSIEDGAALFGPDDRLLACNDDYRRYFPLISDLIKPGISYREIHENLGSRDSHSRSPAERRMLIEDRVRLFNDGANGNEFQLADGSWARADYHKLANGGTFVITADITAQKRAEAELLEAKKEAEAANQVKSEFLSSMSHELRTPLNAILGFSRLLKEAQDQLNPHQKRCVDYIEQSGKHLLHMVNEVLDLTYIEDGQLEMKIEDVSVREALERALPEAMELANTASVSIDIEAFKDQTVRADANRLHQVLKQLLSNAVLYNQQGGSVTVSVSQRAHDMIRILIADTGSGIAEEDHEQIFLPFSRLGDANRNPDGAGIGLTIARRLTETMNGRMGVESAPDKGSVFWFDLPQKDRRRLSRRLSDRRM